MKKTVLYDTHVKLGGRLIDFGGWLLPVMYSSVLTEHDAVRSGCGIFDTSHMGEIRLKGTDAFHFVNFLLSNNLERIKPGKAIYSGLLYENGTFVDDLIAYYLSKEEIFLVVNASNIEKDFDWISSQIVKSGMKVTAVNESSQFSMLAVQGKKAPEYLEKKFPGVYTKLEAFGFVQMKDQGQDLFVTRTGYTGEAGVEIVLPNDLAVGVWNEFGAMGVTPAGLGARDSLRLEQGYSLYGHEINDQTNALEAGLSWTVDFSKSDFIGKKALTDLKAAGLKRKLVGLTMLDRGIPRDGYKLFDSPEVSGIEIGIVTSGTYSPTLKQNIALAYLPSDYASQEVYVEVRDKKLKAKLGKRVFV